ncbi:Asp23/Gls24 family envelope stress response protein [Streptomyces sp. ME01-24h]|nr:Asp23/Gls24 family envelope stress response protein [Streptomyces sp. ME19-03-3]MDX3356942.1 Asp23/Gls24 family envelope stress response protein [Streptomyces sp. ME01-24h]
MALSDRSPPPPADGCPVDEVRRHTGDEVLTCGRTLRHAWEQARDCGPPTDPHVATCTYCRDAVDGLAALARATRALRDREPPDTQTIISRVMDIVRNEVLLGPMLPLGDPTRILRIAEHTAAGVLRSAADSVPGVTTASCRLTRADQHTGTRVSITLAAALNRPLPETAELVRRAVRDAADRALGLPTAAIDVTVIDVHHAVGSPSISEGAHQGPEGSP